MELDDGSFFPQSFLGDLSISIGPIQWFCRLTRRTADKFPLLQPRSHGWVLPIRSHIKFKFFCILLPTLYPDPYSAPMGFKFFCILRPDLYPAPNEIHGWY
ncbi:hypothetical protein XPA_002447 [Xanthoria parietina]